MKKIARLLAIAMICPLTGSSSLLRAQETLTEKPGTFKILSRTDYITSGLSFTQAEITANLEKIKEVVAIVRQNPVLSDIKGFNGRARIYTMSMIEKERYGIPSRISFEFSSFFLSKTGKVVFNTIEPPEWSLYINNLVPGWTGGFNSKHGYFTVPLRKKSPDPGIDVYDGECFVLYDPSRPPYWIPVTVEEAFAAVREENDNDKDRVAAGYMKEWIDREYADIPASERNNPAYFGGNASRISSHPGVADQDSIFPHIMKVNPEYFDRTRPKSDIQFINFRAVQNKEYLKSLLDECKQYWAKGSGSGCDLKRFELSFGMTDIRNLAPLVTK
jgi:hypothetical protein